MTLHPPQTMSMEVFSRPFVARTWTVLVAVWVSAVLLLCQIVDGGGTTANIKDIFIGRCWDFQAIINPTPFKHGYKDCTMLWKKFHQAFSYIDACSVSTDRFTAFAEEAVHPVPRSKTMFWSGVYPFVYKYTQKGQRYTAIADSLSGYLLNDLAWCGQTSNPGVNYHQCPPWGSCNRTAELAFWRAISIAFAKQATGRVYVMLNGSRDNAFRENSVLAEYEIKQFTQDKVDEVYVILAHTIGIPIRETCINGSLIKLRRVIEEKGIKFTCTENPIDLLYLMCADYTDSRECKEISERNGYSISGGTSFTLHAGPLCYLSLIVSGLLLTFLQYC